MSVLALTLAGCSSGDDPGPTPTATKTVTATPSLSDAAARQVCVDAWAKAIEAHAGEYTPGSANGPDVDEPAECKHVPGGSHLDMYMDGLKQRNEEARRSLDECVADPSCTSVPVP